jgi:RHS repeat-associated protein
VTNESGSLFQTLDYYPYGAARVSVSTSTNVKRKFIGQFSDESGLSYLNARFYNPTQGQFLTQDPTFLAVGNPTRLQQLTNQSQQKVLMDPQQLNAQRTTGGSNSASAFGWKTNTQCRVASLEVVYLSTLLGPRDQRS